MYKRSKYHHAMRNTENKKKQKIVELYRQMYVVDSKLDVNTA